MNNTIRKIGATITTAVVMGAGLMAAPAAHAVGLDAATIKANVETQIAAEISGRYRVSVREIGGDNRSFGILQHRAVESASTMKVFYAWLALRAADDGDVRLGSSLPSGTNWRDCLRVMILVSDNLCAADIRESLGNEEINDSLHRADFHDSEILLDPESSYAGKVTSTNDLAEFLVQLHAGDVLSETSTTRLLRLLKLQVWRSRIGAGTPEGIVVASKPGILRIGSGMVQTDAAIVHGENSTYVIAVLGDRGATRAGIRRISRIVYEGLQGVSGYPGATYPARQFTVANGTPMSETAHGPVVGSFSRTRPVELITTDRTRALIDAGNMGDVWVDFARLSLRDAYRWPS